jgi:hypothetical protein
MGGKYSTIYVSQTYKFSGLGNTESITVATESASNSNQGPKRQDWISIHLDTLPEIL